MAKTQSGKRPATDSPEAGVRDANPPAQATANRLHPSIITEELARSARAVLDALRELEEAVEGEHPGPTGWQLFDPVVGSVAALRKRYPPAGQLPAQGQELYRSLWGSLPSEDDWRVDSPYGPEVAARILNHLDQFREWLVGHYALALTEPEPTANLSGPEEVEEEPAAGRIPPHRRTRLLSLCEAAQLMSRPASRKQGRKQAGKLLRRAIDASAVRCEKITRQRYVFDRDDFPAEVHPQLVPTGSNSP